MGIFKNENEKVRVAVVSDLHVNSTIGLCPPVVQLDDGGTYFPSKFQRALWDSWNSYCSDVNSTKSKLYVVVDGDLTDIDPHNRSTQNISRNPSTVIDMAQSVLHPLVKNADKVFIIRGTEAHTGNSGWTEEQVAKDLDNVVYYDKDKDIASFYYLRAIIAGVKFDITHHISMGTLPWTEKNAANKLSAILQFQYMEHEERIPDVAIRAHMHRLSDSGMNYKIHSFTLPAWCVTSSYLHRVGQGNYKSHIGGLIFDCEKGKYDVTAKMYEPLREEAIIC